MTLPVIPVLVMMLWWVSKALKATTTIVTAVAKLTARLLNQLYVYHVEVHQCHVEPSLDCIRFKDLSFRIRSIFAMTTQYAAHQLFADNRDCVLKIIIKAICLYFEQDA